MLNNVLISIQCSMARDKVDFLKRSINDFYEIEMKNLFLVNCSSSATLFCMSRIFDNYIDACRCLKKVLPEVQNFQNSIIDYLTIRKAYYEFNTESEYLHDLLTSVKEGSPDGAKYISDDNVVFIRSLNVLDAGPFPIPFEKYVEMPGVFEKVGQSIIDQTFELMDRLQRCIKLPASFLRGDQLKDYVISKFKQFVVQDAQNDLFELRKAAIRLKNDRLVRLSKQHWADMAELDEQLMDRIIDGESVDECDYACLYGEEEWKMLVSNREILKMLRDTSDPENLYDWTMLFDREERFETIVNGSNVMLLFNRIHRANLVKCELYNGLRMRYDLFLFGKMMPSMSEGEVASASVKQPIPNEEDESMPSDQPPQDASGVAFRQRPSGFIHSRIDEDKLVAFTKDFTDGPNRASVFNKNCLWLCIYIVFCQKHPKLGNKPILVRKARAKFEEWVQTRINPIAYPCYKRSLDTAPPYFRKMKNYPWSLAGYINAKGKKESTYNSYAQVAEYFQRCVFDNIEDFLVD